METPEPVSALPITGIRSTAKAVQEKIYRYPPFKEEREIRLLKIETIPGTGQEYNFTLSHTTIDQAPAYETLSYVWGPNFRDRSFIFHDGCVLRITKNLELAIYEVAPHCSTGYLWVDQICINQDDIEEKNEQVKLMGLIYGSSAQVLIWLGPIDLPPYAALDGICRVATECSPTSPRVPPIFNTLKIFCWATWPLKTMH